MPRIAASRTALYVAAAALALAAPPLLLRAQPDNWDQVRAAVEGMKQAERDRLDRNTREYQSLSEAERDRYRRLHRALQDDAQNNNGRLGATMQDYYAWLASNQAYDRQTLRTTTDPVKRIEEARRIVDERNAAASRSRAWRSRSRWWLWPDAPDLSADQLADLMQALEEQMALSADERRLLSNGGDEEKVGVERYFAVFSILRGRRDKLHLLLERLDVDAAFAAVPGVRLPPDFASQSAEFKRLLLLRTIVGNVLQEYESAVNQRPATTKELADFVAQLPHDEDLDRLLELEPSEFRPRLEQMYAKQANSLDYRDLDEVLPGPGDFRAFGSGFGGPFGGFRRGRGDARRGPGGEFPDRQGDGPPFLGRPGVPPVSSEPDGDFDPGDRNPGPTPGGPPPYGPPSDSLRPPPPGDGQPLRPRAGERPRPLREGPKQNPPPSN